MPKKKVADPFRQQLAIHTSKIAAYKAVGKTPEAREWAEKLVTLLRLHNLIG